jgi:hypothetical protein
MYSFNSFCPARFTPVSPGQVPDEQFFEINFCIFLAHTITCLVIQTILSQLIHYFNIDLLPENRSISSSETCFSIKT